MSRQRELTVETASDVVDARLAVLSPSDMLDVSPDPELDRWIGALRRHTGAAIAALCRVEKSRRLITSLCRVEGSVAGTTELALSESFESHIAGLAHLGGSTDACHLFAEAPVTVNGHVVGQIAIVALGRSDWAEEDLQALDEAAAAASSD